MVHKSLSVLIEINPLLVLVKEVVTLLVEMVNSEL